MWNAGPDPARILNRVGAPHGIRFFADWTAELKAVYGLRVVGEPDE